MPTKRNKTRSKPVAGVTNVPSMPENSFLPPGAPDTDTDNKSASEANYQETNTAGSDNKDYPAVQVINEEEHKAREEAAAKARVERSERATGPRRLSSQETLNMGLLLKLLPEGDDVPLSTPISMESIPEQLRETFFAPGVKNNMATRGLVKLIQNPETKQFDALEITEIGFHLYSRNADPKKPKEEKQKRTVKENGEPRAAGGRTSTQFAGMRLRKMVENPRVEGTMGYFSWQLYQDGMTYQEYMNNKNFPPGQTSKRTGEVFRGPGRNHWDWDLMHGFIALYRDGENETLEDGSPNPNYWAIKNTPNK